MLKPANRSLLERKSATILKGLLASSFLLACSFSLSRANDQEAESIDNHQAPASVSGFDNRRIPDQPFVVVLGIAQDAGYPQAGCQKECCREAWLDPKRRRHAVCLGIVDPISKERFMIECTPDFKYQLRMLEELTWTAPKRLDAIFLTHAHIGHYAGLIHLGREVLGESGMPVHVMPRMSRFLKTNGPWNQLVELKNIDLKPLEADVPVRLNSRITLTPLLVPHRGEYSETIAFIIEGAGNNEVGVDKKAKRILFLPDIDRWEDWDQSIEALIQSVDFALLDGTFLADGELPGRDMSKIPHPTIEHSIKRFSQLPLEDRQKIFFIHLNHTNPLLRPEAEHPVRDALKKSGMSVGEQGQVLVLGK
jgi:pyrroloquinoline quinone biosynthesis protein B